MPITRISGGGGTNDYNSLNNKPDLSLYNKVNGGYNSVATKTTDYTVLLTDGLILCDSSSNINITIPPPADAYNSVLNAGLILNIKNINYGMVTIIGTIDNVENPIISSYLDSITIQSDGTVWHLI